MTNLEKEKLDKKERFKKMPSKSKLKIYFNERHIHTKTKVKRIITYNKDYILFTASVDKMAFGGKTFKLQSVSIGLKEATYYVTNDIYGYGSIISEIEHFRRFPEDAKKRNITVI
jgi:hypothetical protein